MASLMDSFEESDLDDIERSEHFKQVSPEELREILDWIRANPNLTKSNFLCVAHSDQPMPTPDITLSPTGSSPSHERFLEESWVLVDEHDPAASLFVQQNADKLQVKRSFFYRWPSFHLGTKLGWVMSATGTAFFFGYLTGAKAALDSLYSIAKHPFAFAGLGTATAFAAAFAPEMALTALKYIVIGGIFGGAAVATPVFVVGTAGVFVATSVYHSYITTKRLAQVALGRNK